MWKKRLARKAECRKKKKDNSARSSLSCGLPYDVRGVGGNQTWNDGNFLPLLLFLLGASRIAVTSLFRVRQSATNFPGLKCSRLVYYEVLRTSTSFAKYSGARSTSFSGLGRLPSDPRIVKTRLLKRSVVIMPRGGVPLRKRTGSASGKIMDILRRCREDNRREQQTSRYRKRFIEKRTQSQWKAI